MKNSTMNVLRFLLDYGPQLPRHLVSLATEESLADLIGEGLLECDHDACTFGISAKGIAAMKVIEHIQGEK
jgi:hypothetical protein